MSEVRATIDVGACPGPSRGHGARTAGDLTLEVSRGRLLEVAASSKGAPAVFTLLSDLTCADCPSTPSASALAYHLFSSRRGRGCGCACGPARTPEVESVTSVWATANWHEREVYDMFGVRFRNHPDLARILMPLDWEGHPLRRDYPLGGEEVRVHRCRVAADEHATHGARDGIPVADEAREASRPPAARAASSPRPSARSPAPRP